MELRIRPLQSISTYKSTFHSSQATSSSRLHSPKMQVIKSSSTRVLKEKPVPPWLQDVRLVPRGSSRDALNFTDFWTQGQRHSTMKRLHLSEGKSKIKSIFRQREVEEKRKTLSKKIDSLKFSLQLKPNSLKQINTDLDNLNIDYSPRIYPHSVKHSNQLKELKRDFGNKSIGSILKFKNKI